MPSIEGSFFRFANSNGNSEVKEIGNGFSVMEVDGFDPSIPASQDDQYHCYSHVGMNASNTVHHHKFGDVTVFHGNTSPYGEHSKADDMQVRHVGAMSRYVIIADQWTGKRIKVFLPAVDPDHEII